jgi:hypothetical protein
MGLCARAELVSHSFVGMAVGPFFTSSQAGGSSPSTSVAPPVLLSPRLLSHDTALLRHAHLHYPKSLPHNLVESTPTLPSLTTLYQYAWRPNPCYIALFLLAIANDESGVSLRDCFCSSLVHTIDTEQRFSRYLCSTLYGFVQRGLCVSLQRTHPDTVSPDCFQTLVGGE